MNSAKIAGRMGSILALLGFWFLMPVPAEAGQAGSPAPAMNVIFLDDKALGLPAGTELRRNHWPEWETRLPTFLERLKMVAELRRATGGEAQPATALYALEVSASVEPDRGESLVASELQRISGATGRPSAVLARSTAGQDQLRVVFQDSRDYPPAHAAKFLRVLAEISPPIAHRRVAENFGPFTAPPTLVFDPRIPTLEAGATPVRARQRWGVLEDTYLLPHYVLHMLATLNALVSAVSDTFYVRSVPEPGTVAGKGFKIDLYIAGAGINSPPGKEPTEVLRLAMMRAGDNVLVAPLFLKQWKDRGLDLDNPRTATEMRTYASMMTLEARSQGKDILFDVRPDLAPYILNPNLLRAGQDIVDYLLFSPHWISDSRLYALAFDSIAKGHKDANTGGRTHALCHSECGYAFSLATTHFDTTDLFKVRVGPDMLIPRIKDLMTDHGAVVRLYTGTGDYWSLNSANKSIAQGVCRQTGCTAIHDETWRGHGLPLGASNFEVVSGKAGPTRMRLDATRMVESGLSQRLSLDQGGVLFDRGNVYILDLTGRVRAVADKAVAALDASGSGVGKFEESGKAKLVVGVPVGPGKKESASGAAIDLLMCRLDLDAKPAGVLPFAIARFATSGKGNSPDTFGGPWTLEPLVLRGLENLAKKMAAPRGRMVTVIPWETGNRLAYLPEPVDSAEGASADAGPPAMALKAQGGDFQPDLQLNAEGAFSWLLRHGVAVDFTKDGLVQAIRKVGGESVRYVRADQRLTEKGASDGSLARIDYKQATPAEATMGGGASAQYVYEGQRLVKVDAGPYSSSMKYDGAGRMAAIRDVSWALSFSHDAQSRLTKVTGPASEITIEDLSGASILRISGSDGGPVNWHFRPNQGIAGVTQGSTGILWTRSSDGRIIQMALGTITRLEQHGWQFKPVAVVGALP